MPVNGFIAAMNSNNSMNGFFQDRLFIPLPCVKTNSPALDVGFPLNYERLLSFSAEAPAVMRNMVYPSSIDDILTFQTISDVYQKYDIFIDPHTAVAFAAAQKWKGHAHRIVLATGHPGKSANTIKEATGKILKIPESFTALRRKCSPSAIIPPQLDAFKGAIKNYF